MKIIAFYLPQFHEIPENNEFWGKGYTEWTAVKSAKPLFNNHLQPRIPLHDNYYDLTNPLTLKWQVELAKKYGVFGFCFYHYWFNGRLLLEKPIELFLNVQSLTLPFCICWANHSWTDAWVSDKSIVKIKQTYGNEEEWESHFMYLLPYLKDERYIKVNGQPLLIIYQPAEIPRLNEKLEYWRKLAEKNQVGKLAFAYQDITPVHLQGWDRNQFDYMIEYQPRYVRLFKQMYGSKINKFCVQMSGFLSNKIHSLKRKLNLPDFPNVYDYDSVWKKVLDFGPLGKNSFPGAFVNVDTTPRRKSRGTVYQGMTPEKFGKYLKLQIERARDLYKTDMIFLFAWNEWGEGGFLEPDSKYAYQVLEAIQQELIDTNEYHEMDSWK